MSEESLVKDPAELYNAIEQLLAAPYGMQGATVITTGADVHSVHGYCLVAIEDGTQLDASNCVVNWTEDLSASASGVLTTDIVLPVGVPFYGDFKQVTILAGKAILYRK